jgi:hypothetical protein
MNGWVAYRYLRTRKRFFAEYRRLSERKALPQPRLIVNGEG